MKLLLLLILASLTTVGCGALRITPKACKTAAVWGSSQKPGEAITLKSKERYNVFQDRELRLRDLLEQHGLKCEEVKEIRVQIKMEWFFNREVILKVVKN